MQIGLLLKILSNYDISIIGLNLEFFNLIDPYIHTLVRIKYQSIFLCHCLFMFLLLLLLLWLLLLLS